MPLRVAIVDDEPVVCKRLSQALAKEGYAVEAFVSARSFLEAMIEQPFDVVVADMRMPVMDGLQATMKIRSYAREDAQILPIIALTANALDEEEHICLEAGMNARLTKPINPQKLYQTLVQYVTE